MDDKAEAEIRRGHEARLIMDTPLVAEALATIERDHVAAWLSTQPPQSEARERLWYGVQAVIRFRQFFHEVMETGHLAELRVEAENAERFDEPIRGAPEDGGDTSIEGGPIPGSPA